MYQYTGITTAIKTVLSIATLLVLLQADNWLKTETNRIKQGEYIYLTLSTLLGMYFMISSGNFLLFVIGLETASIPMATLVAFDKYNNKSAEAGAKYILSAAFATAISMFGISLIYGTTGTLYFDDLPALITASPLQIMAFVFFAVGLFFKISLVPFHLWTADVYEGAPTTVTAYLSVVSKGAAVFVLFTLLVKVFGNLINEWQPVLYVLIVLSITVGNLFALRQNNMKRFLAFSSISQAGYIVLAVIAGTPQALTALVYYVLVYVFSNLAVFGVVSAIEQRTGKVNISDYNGLYTTNPRLSVIMTLALFSLGGIPFFSGFFSKFFVFMAAAEQGFYVLIFIALINTVISLYYYLIVVKAMIINKNDNPVETIKTDAPAKISLAICMFGVLFAGFFSIIYDQISLLAGL
jgi:NADH-quinone oxidoreductase subunit N